MHLLLCTSCYARFNMFTAGNQSTSETGKRARLQQLDSRTTAVAARVLVSHIGASGTCLWLSSRRALACHTQLPHRSLLSSGESALVHLPPPGQQPRPRLPLRPRPHIRVPRCARNRQRVCSAIRSRWCGQRQTQMPQHEAPHHPRPPSPLRSPSSSYSLAAHARVSLQLRHIISLQLRYRSPRRGCGCKAAARTVPVQAGRRADAVDQLRPGEAQAGPGRTRVSLQLQ